jgi:hypothetical protein
LNTLAASTVAAILAAAACHAAEHNRPMTPDASTTNLDERLWRDFQGREHPIAAREPVRGSDGTWRTPDGLPITHVGIIGWTRPPQVDGAPYKAYVCDAEHRYWVHQESVLGSDDFWFGPFDFSP